MWSCVAIQLKVIVVSARKRRASLVLSQSSFRRCAKSWFVLEVLDKALSSIKQA
jgi:hypothetical protein